VNFTFGKKMKTYLIYTMVLPACIFAGLYLFCRKENNAVSARNRYITALVTGFSFLIMPLFIVPHLNPNPYDPYRELEAAACFACSLGLSITAFRIPTKTSRLASCMFVLSVGLLMIMTYDWVRYAINN